MHHVNLNMYCSVVCDQAFYLFVYKSDLFVICGIRAHAHIHGHIRCGVLDNSEPFEYINKRICQL